MITADEAFEYLLVRNYTTFFKSEFDSAYHYLAAALHLAQATGNTKRLKDIAFIAKGQADLIDRDNPDYRHATVRATRRENRNIFVNLTNQALAAAQWLADQPKVKG